MICGKNEKQKRPKKDLDPYDVALEKFWRKNNKVSSDRCTASKASKEEIMAAKDDDDDEDAGDPKPTDPKPKDDNPKPKDSEDP